MQGKALEWAYEIEGRDFRNAGKVSSKVKEILKELGFDPAFVRGVAIASYEAEMNVVCHAEKGTLHVAILPEALKIVVEDQGPGIPDIELAMQEGYSTAPPRSGRWDLVRGWGFPT
jgi:anti-sigma regulatory factor (Ser/Thr protein kinase)